MELWLIFASAFLAATLLPFYSEFVVAAALANMPENLLSIWLAASFGNTFGAAVNWLAGRYLLRYQDHKWFPFQANSLSSAQVWFQKYGVWSLLFAWLPVGGDPLTFVAGMMRVPFALFFTLTLIGKSIRYLVVIYFAEVVYNAL